MNTDIFELLRNVLRYVAQNPAMLEQVQNRLDDDIVSLNDDIVNEE